MAWYKDDPEYLNKVGGLAGPRAIKQFENEFTRRQTEYGTNPIPMWQYMSPEQRQTAAQSYGGGATQTPARPAQAIPTGNSAYEGFDDQYTSFATTNAAEKARQTAAGPRAAAATAALRGKNPTFDNAYMDKYYKDVQVNGYDPKVAQGLPGMNPATGVGGSAIGAALQAAAARGDWNAVNRYYASKGESFAGMAPPGGTQQGDLYNRAFGPGIKSRRGRDRAALVLQQMMQDERAMDRQKLMNQGAIDVENLRGQTSAGNAKFAAMLGGISRDRGTKQRNLAAEANLAFNFMKQFETPESQAQLQRLSPEEQQVRKNAYAAATQKVIQYQSGGLDSELFSPLQQDEEQYADGGPVPPPVGNPMGTFGQPPSMQSLDPFVREYGQYVHAASMNGLQPVPFGKFINLLSSARQQMQTLPTTGGQYGFADGGEVEEPSFFSRLLGGGTAPATTPAQTDQQRLGQGAAMLGSGMVGQAAQALQGRRSALEEALGAAQGARMGYAGGGAIPVAGKQVLGPGGPRSDSIPAVIDGQRPAALSTGEFVMPTDVTNYWGTAKLQSMIDKARSQ